MLGAIESFSGRPTTMRSKTLPRLPMADGPVDSSIRQSAERLALPSPTRGSWCRRMNSSKTVRARSARSFASRSKPATRSGAAATKPSAPAAMTSGWPGRMCRPSM